MSVSKLPGFYLVSENSRLSFMLDIVGSSFIFVENDIFKKARDLVEGYDGGQWDFVKSDSSSFGYIRPTEKRIWKVNTSFHSVSMSSDALGLALTVMACNHALFAVCVSGSTNESHQTLSNTYDALMDLWPEHPEVDSIAQFLD